MIRKLPKRGREVQMIGAYKMYDCPFIMPFEGRAFPIGHIEPELKFMIIPGSLE